MAGELLEHNIENHKNLNEATLFCDVCDLSCKNKKSLKKHKIKSHKSNESDPTDHISTYHIDTSVDLSKECNECTHSS